MSSFLRGVLLAAILVFAGCTGFKPTVEEQERSLKKFSQTKFSAPLLMPELKLGNIKVDIGDPQMFLKRSSFWIYSADGAADLARFERMIVSKENKDDGAKNSTQMYKGSGFAVSQDGYLLTAAHVVKQPHLLIIVGEYLVGGPVLRCARPRIVFIDEKADFALLKCELATPQMLQIHRTSVPVGTTLFSGGWINKSGAGQLLEWQESRSDTGHMFRKLRSSIPILQGDSGSAVIDSSGRLIGVTTNMVYGRFWKSKEKSRAVMLDPAELQRLIDEDRAKQR